MKIGQTIYAAVDASTGIVLDTPEGRAISEYESIVQKDIGFACRMNPSLIGKYSIMKVRICYGSE